MTRTRLVAAIQVHRAPLEATAPAELASVVQRLEPEELPVQRHSRRCRACLGRATFIEGGAAKEPCPQRIRTHDPGSSPPLAPPRRTGEGEFGCASINRTGGTASPPRKLRPRPIGAVVFPSLATGRRQPGTCVEQARVDGRCSPSGSSATQTRRPNQTTIASAPRPHGVFHVAQIDAVLVTARSQFHRGC